MALSKPTPALTAGQRTALSNGTNLAILVFLLQRPATLAEVAEAHQILPMEANVRLRHLAQEGLVVSSLREGPGGTGERVYQAATDEVALHTQASSNTLDNASQVQLILGQLRRDLTYHALNPDEGKVHLRMIGIRIQPEKFERWLERVRALEQEFDSCDDVTEEAWYFLSVAMYSRPKREVK